MKELDDRQIPAYLRRALQAGRERITAECRVNRMVLFGSVVRGEADEESDTDLLVVLTERPTHHIRDRITSLILDVNLEHDTNLSELIVDRETWDRGLPSALPIHTEIEEVGIRL